MHGLNSSLVLSLDAGRVRKLKQEERTKLLARYNLEVTLAELSRCKQAVHDGTIWQLAEHRSHQHPALREAFLWLRHDRSLRVFHRTYSMIWFKTTERLLETTIQAEVFGNRTGPRLSTNKQRNGRKASDGEEKIPSHAHTSSSHVSSCSIDGDLLPRVERCLGIERKTRSLASTL